MVSLQSVDEVAGEVMVVGPKDEGLALFHLLQVDKIVQNDKPDPSSESLRSHPA